MCHFSYIGDSIVGRNVNVAAGVITAVRRFDGGTIMVRLPGHDLDTKRRKFGALIGDHVQLGIGVLIYPGRTIEPGVCVPPGFVVRRNYPSV
jgi:bifunctional UDP-N-acetylglucosamine pyrophosphorylase/glucosamine-1-phosphate N-acetyltransferase